MCTRKPIINKTVEQTECLYFQLQDFVLITSDQSKSRFLYISWRPAYRQQPINFSGVEIHMFKMYMYIIASVRHIT
jgi:hypothetical protein